MQDTRTPFKAGVVVDGRYEMGDELGRGGFSIVYRARHLFLGRLLAFKVYHPQVATLDTVEFRRAFVQEARIISDLDHPNLPRISDSGVIQGTRQPYISMELLVGRALDQELAAHGAMAAPRVSRLIRGVMEALGRGHEREIVHRDLKPSNLFLRSVGTPAESLVLMDFGVAGHAGYASARTSTGQLVGTPRYLAPEIIAKQPATPATDVYQMALILAEMLTGRPLVDQDTPGECAAAHVEGRLTLPSPLSGQPLGAVLQRALAHDPLDRYVDCNAFASAVQAIADSPTSEAEEAQAGAEVSPESRPTRAPRMAMETGPSDERDAFRGAFRQAIHAYARGDLVQALGQFRICRRYAPDHPLVLHNIAALERRRKSASQAPAAGS